MAVSVGCSLVSSYLVWSVLSNASHHPTKVNMVDNKEPYEFPAPSLCARDWRGEAAAIGSRTDGSQCRAPQMREAAAVFTDITDTETTGGQGIPSNNDRIGSPSPGISH